MTPSSNERGHFSTNDMEECFDNCKHMFLLCTNNKGKHILLSVWWNFDMGFY